jgi:hypothetical protein
MGVAPLRKRRLDHLARPDQRPRAPARRALRCPDERGEPLERAAAGSLDLLLAQARELDRGADGHPVDSTQPEDLPLYLPELLERALDTRGAGAEDLVGADGLLCRFVVRAEHLDGGVLLQRRQRDGRALRRAFALPLADDPDSPIPGHPVHPGAKLLVGERAGSRHRVLIRLPDDLGDVLRRELRAEAALQPACERPVL